MKEVRPEAHLLAYTEINHMGVQDFLTAMGVSDDWTFTNDKEYLRTSADMLAEVAGRTCYQSFGTDLNDNISRVREDPRAYLRNVLESAHGSVFEHVSMTFGIHNVSRIFTHELVRHRVGIAISQESLRYVRVPELRAWIPPELEPVRDEFVAHFEATEALKAKWSEQLITDGMSFGDKKKLTSAMRRINPEGAATTIVWTGNVRIMRHVIERRTHRSAEREIRLVFADVAKQVVSRWPLLFGDYTAVDIDGINEYTTSFEKV